MMKTSLSFFPRLHFRKALNFTFKILVLGLVTTAFALVSKAQVVWTLVGSADFSAGSSSFMSIAINPIGIPKVPYVAYQDGGNGDRVTVMDLVSGTWTLVGTAGFSAIGGASFTSLAFNTSGNPYVAYEDGGASNKATVMEFNGTSWVVVGAAGFSAGTANSTSLAINSSGTPYVAYEDGGNSNKATVKKFDGTNWVTVGIAGFSTGVAAYTSLAIASDGTPYVAYQDGANSQKATVMKFDGSNWVVVGTAAFSAGTANFISLAFNPINHNPYVAYEDGGNSQKATAMEFDGTNWVTVGAAGFSGTATSTQYTSIAISPLNGIPCVAYVDNSSGGGGRATVMKFDGTNWSTVGSQGFSTGTISYSSLAFNSNGIAYVAYSDAPNSYKATVEETSGPVVPIRLVDFTGKAIKDIAALSWTTASEQNNAYFEVQRSNDGVNFNQIGQVSGHGTTNLTEQYNFTDQHPELNGINYYRLDQVDYDGHMTYSKVITLRFDGGPLTFQLYPNPVSKTLYLSLPVTENKNLIQIYSSGGKLLMTRIFSRPNNNIGLDVSGLSGGTYFLKITPTNGTSTSLKFIKQ